MISDERLEVIAKYDTFVSLGETEAMAKEIQAYRKAFSEPAGWLLIGEEGAYPGFTERELIKDLFMVIERNSHEPLYRKPTIPE